MLRYLPVGGFPLLPPGSRSSVSSSLVKENKAASRYFCVALGYVRQQIWIPAKKRWAHADPCENKLDTPLMYEQGWNKRLSYVLAFDRNGSVDVTRR